MTALLIILAALVLLAIGYVYYGSWLAKQWGIDPKKKTPAFEKEDGVDYVAAKPAVLMGHHFSSIAGAGPINGPIQAAVFGWIPVFLWCVVGGIFFGGLQDFGSLFASIRHEGKSVGEIIKDSMGAKSKKLFIIFSLLVLILVIASFVNVVAATFLTVFPTADAVKAGAAAVKHGFVLNPNGNQTTAMISICFIALAVVYGFITNRCGVKTLPATIICVAAVVGVIMLGLNVGLAYGRITWIVVIGLYIVVASLIPVWIMLQPRDYLSSFLLYAMILIALVGIFVGAFTGAARGLNFDLPAFTGWKQSIGTMFPALFITVACGACSGFHSLIASGTTSKQLDAEQHAKPIAYGSMLIESALGIISLIAVGMVSSKFLSNNNGIWSFNGSPASAFGSGIALFFGDESTKINATIQALLTLAVSVFALTSLDSATRLSRFMFSELFLKDGEETWRDAKGFRRVLANPLFGTCFMVIIGCILGGLKLSAIWALFGSANQLLAGIALLAVAAWLGQAGKNNKMFFIPMAFMLAATLTQLVLTIVTKLAAMAGGAANAFHWGNWFQLFFAAAMGVLAIILVIEGVKTFANQRKAKIN